MSQDGFGLAGVIGMPVAHSRSPVIHNYWLNAHGIRGAYVPLAVQPERLEDALDGLVALGLPRLQRHHAAQADGDGAARPRQRHRTDVSAPSTPSSSKRTARCPASTMTATALCRACATPSRTGARDAGPILLLGAGGAARAVVVALLENGAREIRIANRTAEKAQAIADEFGSAVSAVPWDGSRRGAGRRRAARQLHRPRHDRQSRRSTSTCRG